MLTSKVFKVPSCLITSLGLKIGYCVHKRELFLQKERENNKLDMILSTYFYGEEEVLSESFISLQGCVAMAVADITYLLF